MTTPKPPTHLTLVERLLEQHPDGPPGLERGPLAVPMIERLELANEAELLEPFLAHVEHAMRHKLANVLSPELLDDAVKDVRAWVAGLVHDDGFCNYGFHRSEPEFEADGKCASCGKDVIDHDRVLVCPREFVE
jgi:hypothetical protein